MRRRRMLVLRAIGGGGGAHGRRDGSGGAAATAGGRRGVRALALAEPRRERSCALVRRPQCHGAHTALGTRDALLRLELPLRLRLSPLRELLLLSQQPALHLLRLLALARLAHGILLPLL